MNPKTLLLICVFLLAGLICSESKKAFLTRLVTLNKIDFELTKDYVFYQGDTMNIIIHIESDFK